MKDEDKVASITSLETVRQRRQEQDSLAFELTHYVFDEDGIGADKIGVTVLLNEKLEGIYMSPDDAEALGVTLIQSAAIARMEQDGTIEFVDEGPDAG